MRQLHGRSGPPPGSEIRFNRSTTALLCRLVHAPPIVFTPFKMLDVSLHLFSADVVSVRERGGWNQVSTTENKHQIAHSCSSRHHFIICRRKIAPSSGSSGTTVRYLIPPRAYQLQLVERTARRTPPTSSAAGDRFRTER